MNVTGEGQDKCDNIYNDVWDASMVVNPCWDVYQVATTCPLLWDVLGCTSPPPKFLFQYAILTDPGAVPGSSDYQPVGSQVYFDRADVKKAIHAPNVTWQEVREEPSPGP